MYFIKATPNETGNHGNPTSKRSEGMVGLPEPLLRDYIDAKGFVYITVSDDVVTAVSVNQEAYDAFMAEDEGNQKKHMRADKDYEPGDYLTLDGKLYKVLLPIFAGSQVTPGTNAEETTTEAEMANLNQEVN